MKNLLKFVSGLILAAAGFLPAAYAQVALPQTTLAAAISTETTQTVVVTSATGMTAGTTLLVVDREAMLVNAINGTILTVQRGTSQSKTSKHLNSSVVFNGPARYFRTAPIELTGTCTRSEIPALPRVNTQTGVISDCIGGFWVNGITSPQTWFRFPNPNTGGTAYTSINSTGTAPSATVQNCSEVFLPFNKNLTGIGILNGTSADGTDKHLIALYDSNGTLLANSALAGTATSGTSTYQLFPFTALFYAVGPARYFACMQSNGATNTVRMIVTGTQDTFLTKGVTGQTFGTLVNITVPTTFTTAVGPYVELY